MIKIPKSLQLQITIRFRQKNFATPFQGLFIHPTYKAFKQFMYFLLAIFFSVATAIKNTIFNRNELFFKLQLKTQKVIFRQTEFFAEPLMF